MVTRSGSGEEYFEIHQLSPGLLLSFLIGLPDILCTVFQGVLHSTAWAVFLKRNPSLSVPFLEHFLPPITFQIAFSLLGRLTGPIRTLPTMPLPSLASISYRASPLVSPQISRSSLGKTFFSSLCFYSLLDPRMPFFSSHILFMANSYSPCRAQLRHLLPQEAAKTPTPQTAGRFPRASPDPH